MPTRWPAPVRVRRETVAGMDAWLASLREELRFEDEWPDPARHLRPAAASTYRLDTWGGDPPRLQCGHHTLEEPGNS
jgi:hypothetical protein